MAVTSGSLVGVGLPAASSAVLGVLLALDDCVGSTLLVGGPADGEALPLGLGLGLLAG